ncbi:unnamed protein product [Ectocarpus fasciculatus]
MKTNGGEEGSEEEEEVAFDLAAAVATFRALAEQMDVFRRKDLKPLRRALHPLVVAARSASGLKEHCVNLSGEISNALNLRQWETVFHKVLEMKRARMVPKLGALQRWVRQCGDVLPKQLAIFLLSRIIDLTSATGIDEAHAKRLTASYALFASDEKGEPETASRQLVVMPPFLPAHRQGHGSVLSSPYPIKRDNFIVDSCVLGKDRRPPSSIDMNIYRAKKDAIVACDTCHGVCSDEVPGVPGALLLSNVLSPAECAQLIQSAEMLGYYDDAVEGIEALVWISDDTLLRPIFQRCKNLLPQTSHNGKQVAGINPRLRFFRYGEGAVYRPHIDGSWTANGDAALLNSSADEIHSYYTFLIYLNGGFEGGGTTFFVPPSGTSGDYSAEGSIIARSVQPVQGSVLCFPHGVVEGSLVHEGSAVTGNGKKYVIRTDLMFS